MSAPKTNAVPWPLGPARAPYAFEANVHGALMVDGLVVSDPQGWIRVRMPPEAQALGAPLSIQLQVKLRVDGDSRVDFVALGARAGLKEYPSVAALAADGALWVRHLAAAFHLELVRAVESLRKPTMSFRVVRPVPVEITDESDARHTERDRTR